MFLVQSVKVGGFLSPMSPDYGLRDTRVPCFVIPRLIQQTCFQLAPPQDIYHLSSFFSKDILLEEFRYEPKHRKNCE